MPRTPAPPVPDPVIAMLTDLAFPAPWIEHIQNIEGIRTYEDLLFLTKEDTTGIFTRMASLQVACTAPQASKFRAIVHLVKRLNAQGDTFATPLAVTNQVLLQEITMM